MRAAARKAVRPPAAISRRRTATASNTASAHSSSVSVGMAAPRPGEVNKRYHLHYTLIRGSQIVWAIRWTVDALGVTLEGCAGAASEDVRPPKARPWGGSSIKGVGTGLGECPRGACSFTTPQPNRSAHLTSPSSRSGSAGSSGSIRTSPGRTSAHPDPSPKSKLPVRWRGTSTGTISSWSSGTKSSSASTGSRGQWSARSQRMTRVGVGSPTATVASGTWIQTPTGSARRAVGCCVAAAPAGAATVVRVNHRSAADRSLNTARDS